MIYSVNTNSADILKITNKDSSSSLVNNEPFNVDKIESIISCDRDFIEEKENLIEIRSLLKNLSQHTNYDSEDDTAGSQEEIRIILSRNTSNGSIDTVKSGGSFRQISLAGRVLLSDNNILSKIICPIKNTKLIPVRVSNPVYKNFDRDY